MIKNKYQHNEDGTTHIFVESKNKYCPGKHTIIIDTEDWDKVKEYRWCIRAGPVNRYPYAMTAIPHPDGGLKKCGRKRTTTLSLHHLILGKPPKGKVTDHRNHNGLDNRKDNLRILTQSQNMFNRRGKRNTSSRYKGISWCKDRGKWRASIWINKKNIYIGYFTCEKEAAMAVNDKARELGLEEHFLFNEVE